MLAFNSGALPGTETMRMRSSNALPATIEAGLPEIAGRSESEPSSRKNESALLRNGVALRTMDPRHAVSRIEGYEHAGSGRATVDVQTPAWKRVPLPRSRTFIARKGDGAGRNVRSQLEFSAIASKDDAVTRTAPSGQQRNRIGNRRVAVRRSGETGAENAVAVHRPRAFEIRNLAARIRVGARGRRKIRDRHHRCFRNVRKVQRCVADDAVVRDAPGVTVGDAGRRRGAAYSGRRFEASIGKHAQTYRAGVETERQWTPLTQRDRDLGLVGPEARIVCNRQRHRYRRVAFLRKRKTLRAGDDDPEHRAPD